MLRETSFCPLQKEMFSALLLQSYLVVVFYFWIRVPKNIIAIINLQILKSPRCVKLTIYPCLTTTVLKQRIQRLHYLCWTQAFIRMGRPVSD